MMESMSFTYCRCGEPVVGRSGMPCPNCGRVHSEPSYTLVWWLLGIALAVVLFVLLVVPLASARTPVTLVPNFDPATVRHGDTVTFTITPTLRGSPTVQLDCFSDPYYYHVLHTDALPLGVGYTLTAADWTAGGGDCTATLFSGPLGGHDQSVKVIDSFTFEVHG